LRRFTENDADALFELYDDPAVMKYLNGGRPADRTEIVTKDLPAFLGYYERFPSYGFWAAIEKHSGDFLGWFHFRTRPQGPVDEPELGYRLHQAAVARPVCRGGMSCVRNRVRTLFLTPDPPRQTTPRQTSTS